MPLPYQVSVNLSRGDAKDLILRLADDEAFRDEFQTDTLRVLQEHQIELNPEALPDEVVLPDPDAIRDFLSMVEETIVPESASPFALIVLIFALGAMPVTIGDRPLPDGAG